MPKSEKPTYFEATINILGYQEEGEWVALALEMDIRGYGPTWDDAVADLQDMVLMQISFAHFKGQPEMIWRRAADEYWTKFAETQREKLVRVLAQESEVEGEATHHAGGLALPPAYVIEAMRGRFDPANA